MAIYYPPAFINAYLAEKVRYEFNVQYQLQNPGAPETALPEITIPFFPTSPTSIDDLTETLPGAYDNVFAVYDRMLKYRRSSFPHIKNEQLMYYFYKTAGDPEQLIEATQIVQDYLDREDESAINLNKWISSYQAQNPGTPVPVLDDDGNQRCLKLDSNKNCIEFATQPTARIGGKDFLLPYFHRIKVYQLQETRDIVDFGTARTFAGNKMIIDYEWHKSA